MAVTMTIFDTSLYKDFPFRHILEYEAIRQISAAEIASDYLQERMNYWGKKHNTYEWLHLFHRFSNNNDLCFIYQDNVFSVLLEINNEHRENNPSKQRFIEHCKKNNMIPCLFPVTPKLLLDNKGYLPGLYVDDKGIPEFTFEVGSYPAIIQQWKHTTEIEYIDKYILTDKNLEPTKLRKQYDDISNWNLVNALTYEPIYPHKLAPNKQTRPSFYEFECRSFNFADQAIRNGKLVKSIEMGYPQAIFKLPVETEISEEHAKKIEELNKTHPGVLYTPITEEKYCAVLVKTFDSTEEFNQIRNTYKFPLKDIYDFKSIKESGVGFFCAIVYENCDKRKNVTCRKICSIINKLYTDNKYCYLEFNYDLS